MNETALIPDEYRLESYQFALPQEQIAQFPREMRGSSRLMVLERGPESDYPPTITHAFFHDLVDYLPEGALLVANNSKVLQARLLGKRATGGKIEFLLLTPLPLLLAELPAQENGWSHVHCEGLFRSGAKVHIGDVYSFDDNLSITIMENGPYGHKKVLLSFRGELSDLFRRIGHIPLPPYIQRSDTSFDLERYQTVYAKEEKTGSVAAPTAGLHFTKPLLDELQSHGFEWSCVTLYVGYGTFSPVRSADIRKHNMHSEYIEISEETAASLSQARREKRPIIAVGTTSLRALEGMARAQKRIVPYAGFTNIFLYPGQDFHIVDGLITNFHLPASSLLMLVSAFAGRKRILKAYEEAIANEYRFFSYGDAMFIRPLQSKA